MDFASTEFWIALGQLMMINVVLSGDNAVVIALASRNLPPQHQKKAILFGSGGAIVLRIVLTFFAVALLDMHYIKLIGSVLLMWIGVKLLVPEEDHDGMEASADLMGAVKTIIVADLVMSLDNVIAVAAAAKGNVPLLLIGLGISIPLIVFGSTLMLKLMDRYPVIVTIGGGLLGYVAGEMAVSDGAIAHWVETSAPWLHQVAPVAGAVLVVVIGRMIATSKKQPVHNSEQTSS